MKKIVWSGLLLLLLVASCGDPSGDGPLYRGGPPDYSAAMAGVSDYIEWRMQQDVVAGLAAALVDGSEVVWAKGFGYADLAGREKVDPDVIFEIGSISKVVTACAVMREKEKGLVDLDRPVVEFFPGFAVNQSFPESGPITLRNMMTHHAGIPGDILIGAFTAEYDPNHLDWMLNYLRDDFTAYPVNFLMSYSNAGVYLEGEAAAAAVGRPFVELGDAFLADLGMTASSFVFQPALEERMAKGYYLSREVPRVMVNMPAAGSIRSSVLDMAKFIKMVLAGGWPVLSPAGLEEMLTPWNADVPLDLDSEIGLAWILSDPEMAYAGRTAWHNGSTIVFNSHLEILLDQGLGVVVLTNAATGGDCVADAAREILVEALKTKKGLSPPTPAEPEYSPPAQWSQEDLEALAGVYTVESQGPVVFTAVAGGLTFTPYGQDQAVFVIPRENGFFSKPDSQASQYEFTNISGLDVIVGHTFGTRYILAQKYGAAPPPPPDAWVQRAGVYRIANLPDNDMSNFVPIPDLRTVPETVELAVENGLLLFKKMSEVYVVDPATDDRGVLFGLGRANGSSLRADSLSGQTRLTLLGAQFLPAAEGDRVFEPPAKTFKMM
ncbi:MAG: serine hydrolase domain-containing protein [Pseudomonadota bacterium]